MNETAQNNFENQPAPPSVTANLFDADAEQCVGLTLKKNGKKHKVSHVFRAMTDDEFFEYEKRKNIVQKVSGTDVLNVQTDDKTLAAAEWLWNLLAIDRRGYKFRPDWREATNLLDKRKAVEEGLLAVFVVEEDEIEPFTDESESELFDDEFNDDAPTIIKLDCLFNEQAMTTEHYFRQPSAKDVSDYEQTMRKVTNMLDTRRGFRQKKGEQTAQIVIPSKARDLCALYDRLIEGTEGYAGRVPAHHKREAVLELFARDVELTEKN